MADDSINYTVRLILYTVKVLVHEAFFGWLGNHLDFPEHNDCFRLIHSVEVAINNKKCSYAKFCQGTCTSELIKLRS